jgi:hypothetical protein
VETWQIAVIGAAVVTIVAMMIVKRSRAKA